jgi:Phage major capsid protein E
MSMLDIFKSDAFSLTSLTDAINKIPYVPGRAGAIIPWQEMGVSTTTIAVEEYGGQLSLILPTPRGGPGQTRGKVKRTGHNLTIPHYEINDAIYAEEVQNVRAFGSENQFQTVADMVNMRMTEAAHLSLDPTLEYQRMGALKGLILNSDGSTLYNLFTEFGVAQPSAIPFALGTSSGGVLRQLVTGALRTVAQAMGGQPYDGVYALCSDTFWDALIANAEVRATYLNQQEARELRAGVVYETFAFGGITWENYRGAQGIGGLNSPAFIATDTCQIFPIGGSGLWRTAYAPADYIETVNTTGLPRYAKQYPMENGKGVNFDMQSNALNFCTRPAALIVGNK